MGNLIDNFLGIIPGGSTMDSAATLPASFISSGLAGLTSICILFPLSPKFLGKGDIVRLSCYHSALDNLNDPFIYFLYTA